jgi:E3 ubiquitin-protein ligase SHPRH
MAEQSGYDRCPASGDLRRALPAVCLPAGTKVEAIVRRLLLLLQLDAAHKVIIFSSWLDVLDILSHALTANGIHHAFGRGRKGFLQALEHFKGCAVAAAEVAAGEAGGPADEAAGELGSARRSMHGDCQQVVQQGKKQQRAGGANTDAAEQIEIDLIDDEEAEAAEEEGSREGEDAAAGTAAAAVKPSSAARPSTRSAAAAAASAAGAGVACRTRPRVLLMLVTHGAAGLNLTEAQHVVLVEPLLDPAQELQATGRISRFGQTATTHVHRWVVGAVERCVVCCLHGAMLWRYGALCSSWRQVVL